MIIASLSPYGVAAAIAQIQRAQFDQAEDRLREKMKPARLAASDATIAEIESGIPNSEFRNPNS